MRRGWPPTAFWLALALGLRLAFALHLGDRFHQTDELGYSTAAWQLASEGVLGAGGKPEVTPPVPGAFFALFFLLGRRLLWPRLGQAFVGALTAWLVGRITRELTRSEAAGRLALAVSAVYPFFIYYGGMVMLETLYVAAVVSGLWWLCRALEERRGWRAPAAGFALGLAALCRAEAAPLAALMWLGGLVLCLRRRWAWRSLALAVLCWALPLGLWCARNKVETGSAALDTHGGMAMVHGSILFELNEIDTGVAMQELERQPFYQESLTMTPAQRDRVLLRAALRYMWENPGLTLLQWSRKAVNFWRFYPRLDKAYTESEHSHPGLGLDRSILILVSLLFEPALILGGLWGLWGLRRRWETLYPLGVFVLGTMAIHVVSVSQMRYRLPIMPVLILGACAAAAKRLKTS